jgi:hypothetical protein
LWAGLWAEVVSWGGLGGEVLPYRTMLVLRGSMEV